MMFILCIIDYTLNDIVLKNLYKVHKGGFKNDGGSGVSAPLDKHLIALIFPNF